MAGASVTLDIVVDKVIVVAVTVVTVTVVTEVDVAVAVTVAGEATRKHLNPGRATDA